MQADDSLELKKPCFRAGLFLWATFEDFPRSQIPVMLAMLRFVLACRARLDQDHFLTKRS
jgi:hypothetical protein